MSLYQLSPDSPAWNSCPHVLYSSEIPKLGENNKAGPIAKKRGGDSFSSRFSAADRVRKLSFSFKCHLSGGWGEGGGEREGIGGEGRRSKGLSGGARHEKGIIGEG